MIFSTNRGNIRIGLIVRIVMALLGVTVRIVISLSLHGKQLPRSLENPKSSLLAPISILSAVKATPAPSAKLGVPASVGRSIVIRRKQINTLIIGGLRLQPLNLQLKRRAPLGEKLESDQPVRVLVALRMVLPSPACELNPT